MSDHITDPTGNTAAPHADRARSMRTALNKVVAWRDPTNPAINTITFEETVRICYFYDWVENLLRSHLDRLRGTIVQYGNERLPSAKANEVMRYCGRVQRHLSSMHEIIESLGAARHSFPRVQENPLMTLRTSVAMTFYHFRLIETMLLAADARQSCCCLHRAIRELSFASFHHQIMSLAYRIPELSEIFAHVGTYEGSDLDGYLKTTSGAATFQFSIPDSEPASEAVEEEIMCYICWGRSDEDPPSYEESLGDNPRPYPAIEVRDASWIRTLCCGRAAPCHMACLVKSIPDPTTPRCPHCQQDIQFELYIPMLSWQTKEYSRKALKLRDLIVEDQTDNP